MPPAAGGIERKYMKPRNFNPKSRKGPLKITIHSDSFALLMRLNNVTGLLPEDIIHHALNCFIATMFHLSKHPQRVQKYQEKHITKLPASKILNEILAEQIKGEHYDEN
jgi:hypothetical protein